MVALDDLKKSLPFEKCPDWTKQSVILREYGSKENHMVIEYTREYDAPPLNFETLHKISELFGTKEIHVDTISQSGCETCDYGSSYGHRIIIGNPTKNIPDQYDDGYGSYDW